MAKSAKSKGRQINQSQALTRLQELFEQAETEYRDDTPTDISAAIVAATERLFSSETQAYRPGPPPPPCPPCFPPWPCP